MKIYYYKQQQNTCALFGKKNSPIKLRYILTIAAFFVICSLGVLKLKGKSFNQISTSLNVSQILPHTQKSISSSQLDAETQATFLNIQNNIEEHANFIEDKAPTQKNNNQHSSSIKLDTSHLVIIQPGDTLGRIFVRLGLNKKELAAVIAADNQAKALKKLKPGQKLNVAISHHQLQKLSYEADPLYTLIITRHHNTFLAQTKMASLEPKQSFAKFTVYGSIPSSAKKAGLDAKRTVQLATIFKSNIDFNKGNHTGDKVSVLFQDYFLNGKKVKTGDIIAAEYKTATNTYQTVRFTDPKGNSGYYAPDGTSMQKKFLPAPLKFTRISSLFNLKRWHPILHRFRHHEGVDYAAPYGTPIKSVANGTIALLGRKGGYGNTIIIKHDSSYSTLYGHLSKYASNLKMGSQVHFATFEMKIILRRVFARCDLRAPDPKPESPRRRFVTYPPNHGAQIVLQSRR